MLKPLVKYPGGKERELKYILPNLPSRINNYYEPFVGGGAVYFSIRSKAQNYLINDISNDLINLYSVIKNQDKRFFNYVRTMNEVWNYSDIEANNKIEELQSYFNKISIKEYEDKVHKLQYSETFLDFFEDKSIIVNELFSNIKRKINYLLKKDKEGQEITKQGFKDIIQTAFKSAIYMYYRSLYNLPDKKDKSENAALYLFMRQYAYSSMFRFSKSGKFNVPYGGKSYNNIYLKDKITYYKNKDLINYLNNTVIENKDFEQFLNSYSPHKDDFLFIDPPYDSEFSKYDNMSFDAQEQRRLANYLINKTEANWMIIIKDTPLVRELYVPGTYTSNNKQIYVDNFKKKYSVNFKNRNSQRTQHLLITNYALD